MVLKHFSIIIVSNLAMNIADFDINPWETEILIYFFLLIKKKIMGRKSQIVILSKMFYVLFPLFFHTFLAQNTC